MGNAGRWGLLLGVFALFAGSCDSSWAQPSITIQVTAEELVREPVSPLIYGNFIESGFGRQVDGLWAEMLFNRSFESVPPYKEGTWRWLRSEPGAQLSGQPWWHSGYEEPAW